MRACATAHAVFAGLVVSVLSFAACSSSSTTTQPQPPPEPDSHAPALSTAIDMPGAQPDPPPPHKEYATTEDCKQVSGTSTLVNEPPSNGTVMNNAMTAGDAGASDRMQPLLETVKSRRDAFRCCFDIWAKKNATDGGRILMVWNLKPDGSLDKVSVDATKGTLHVPEVEACMVAVASTLAYPPSPSKKLTTFTYPFEFRPKK